MLINGKMVGNVLIVRINAIRVQMMKFVEHVLIQIELFLIVNVMMVIMI